MASRIFQINLRTIFELTFVVAVILGFIYWRRQPVDQPKEPPPGRYQLIVDPDDYDRRMMFDSATGESWRKSGSGDWYKQTSPLQPK